MLLHDWHEVRQTRVEIFGYSHILHVAFHCSCSTGRRIVICIFQELFRQGIVKCHGIQRHGMRQKQQKEDDETGAVFSLGAMDYDGVVVTVCEDVAEYVPDFILAVVDSVGVEARETSGTQGFCDDELCGVLVVAG